MPHKLRSARYEVARDRRALRLQDHGERTDQGIVVHHHVFVGKLDLRRIVVALRLHGAGLCRNCGLHAATLLRHEHRAKAHKGYDKKSGHQPGARLPRRPGKGIARLGCGRRLRRLHDHRLKAADRKEDVPVHRKPLRTDTACHDIRAVDCREDLAQRVATRDGRIDRDQAVVCGDDCISTLHEPFDGDGTGTDTPQQHRSANDDGGVETERPGAERAGDAGRKRARRRVLRAGDDGDIRLRGRKDPSILVAHKGSKDLGPLIDHINEPWLVAREHHERALLALKVAFQDGLAVCSVYLQVLHVSCPPRESSQAHPTHVWRRCARR